MRKRQFDLRGDRRALFAAPDKPGIRPCAQCQPDGIEQDGLARAGFAGEHGKARVQVDLQRGDDDEVAQRQALEHQFAPSYQRSLRRSVA